MEMLQKRILIITAVAILILGGLGAAIFALVKSDTSQPAATQSTPTNKSAPTAKYDGTSLDYSNYGLTEFPKSILDNTKLTSLNLSHNSLTGALPAEIKNLSKLQNLNVSFNNMTGVPAEIGQMKSLQILNYSDNQLSGLPMELGNLTQLKILDLSGNPNLSQQDLSQIAAKLKDTRIIK